MTESPTAANARPHPLKISIISDAGTWMNAHIPSLIDRVEELGHHVTWVHSPPAIPSGDLLFLLSCTNIVSPTILARNRNNLVIHQSALPHGRGWSPLSWQILEGANVIPVSLLEAADRVDSGLVYARDEIVFTGQELVEGLREGQARVSSALVLRFLAEYPEIVDRGLVQDDSQATYYPRRGADSCRLDPDKTLREQFNLLRIADNERYPAYFDLGEEAYVLKIEKRRRAAPDNQSAVTTDPTPSVSDPLLAGRPRVP